MMRQKMSRQERAKQFAPFDALKGLNDALRTVEAEHEKKLKNAVTLAQEVDAEDIIQGNFDNLEIIFIYIFYEKWVCFDL